MGSGATVQPELTKREIESLLKSSPRYYASDPVAGRRVPTVNPFYAGPLGKANTREDVLPHINSSSSSSMAYPTHPPPTISSYEEKNEKSDRGKTERLSHLSTNRSLPVIDLVIPKNGRIPMELNPPKGDGPWSLLIHGGSSGAHHSRNHSFIHFFDSNSIKSSFNSLEALSLIRCGLSSLLNFSGFSHLRKLDVSYNAIQEFRWDYLPPHLRNFDITGNNLNDWPSSNADDKNKEKILLPNLPNLRKLSVAENFRLTGYPPEIYPSFFPSLRQLDLSRTMVLAIPTSWATFKSLQCLGIDWFAYCSPPQSIYLVKESLSSLLRHLHHQMSLGRDYIPGLEVIRVVTDYLNSDDHPGTIPHLLNAIEPSISKHPQRPSDAIRGEKRSLEVLHDAVTRFDVATIAIILKDKKNAERMIRRADQNGETPLSLAVRDQRSSLIPIIISPRQSFDGPTEPLLHTAVANLDLDTAKALIQAGAPLESRDSRGNGLWHVLVMNFDSSKGSAFGRLLQDLSTSSQNHRSWSAIHLATCTDDDDALSWIIDVELSHQCSKKKSPLRFNMNLPGGPDGTSVLHLVAYYQRFSSCRQLLDRDDLIDPTSTNRLGLYAFDITPSNSSMRSLCRNAWYRRLWIESIISPFQDVSSSTHPSFLPADRLMLSSFPKLEYKYGYRALHVIPSNKDDLFGLQFVEMVNDQIPDESSNSNIGTEWENLTDDVSNVGPQRISICSPRRDSTMESSVNRFTLKGDEETSSVSISFDDLFAHGLTDRKTTSIETIPMGYPSSFSPKKRLKLVDSSGTLLLRSDNGSTFDQSPIGCFPEPYLCCNTNSMLWPKLFESKKRLASPHRLHIEDKENAIPLIRSTSLNTSNLLLEPSNQSLSLDSFLYRQSNHFNQYLQENTHQEKTILAIPTSIPKLNSDDICLWRFAPNDHDAPSSSSVLLQLSSKASEWLFCHIIGRLNVQESIQRLNNESDTQDYRYPKGLSSYHRSCDRPIIIALLLLVARKIRSDKVEIEKGPLNGSANGDKHGILVKAISPYLLPFDDNSDIEGSSQLRGPLSHDSSLPPKSKFRICYPSSPLNDNHRSSDGLYNPIPMDDQNNNNRYDTFCQPRGLFRCSPATTNDRPIKSPRRCLRSPLNGKTDGIRCSTCRFELVSARPSDCGLCADLPCDRCLLEGMHTWRDSEKHSPVKSFVNNGETHSLGFDRLWKHYRRQRRGMNRLTDGRIIEKRYSPSSGFRGSKELCLICASLLEVFVIGHELIAGMG